MVGVKAQPADPRRRLSSSRSAREAPKVKRSIVSGTAAPANPRAKTRISRMLRAADLEQRLPRLHVFGMPDGSACNDRVNVGAGSHGARGGRGVRGERTAALCPRTRLRDIGDGLAGQGDDRVGWPLGRGRVRPARMQCSQHQVLEDAPDDLRIVDQGALTRCGFDRAECNSWQRRSRRCFHSPRICIKLDSPPTGGGER